MTVFLVEHVIVEFPKCKRWKGLLEEIEPDRYRLPAYDRESIETDEDSGTLFNMWRFMQAMQRMRN